MARLLYRLGTTAFRRWPAFLAAWLLLLVGLGFAVNAIAKPMVDDFTIPGIQSVEAQDLERELFPDTPDALDQANVTVVVAAPHGHRLSEPTYTRAVDAFIADLAGLPQFPDGVTLPNPVVAAEAQSKQVIGAAVRAGTPRAVAEANAQAVSPLSPDGRIGLLTFTWAADRADVEPATQQALIDLMAEHADRSGLTIEANGNGMQTMPELGGSSELIGIGIAAVILLISFGSMVAAGLPILTALVGVGVGIMGISISTAFTDVGTTTPMLATMIGLAVGIDYTLFILSRYRTELRHTEDRAEAVGRAVGTAGSAVVFAGLTVLIALAALAVVRIPFLTSMGMAAALTVLTAVLVALTLLPAVLGLLQGRAFGGQVRTQVVRRDAAGLVDNSGVRWARFISRRPLVLTLLVVATLGALAVPVAGLRLGLPTDAVADSDTTQRQASDLITEGFGPGREAPLLVVVDGRAIDDEPTRQQAFGQVVAWASGMDGVHHAQIVAANSSGATVLVTPDSGAADAATTDLLTDLRSGQAEIADRTATTVGVTGLTAIQADVSDRLTEALPIYLAVVIGLAFALLMLVFRSILVPLTATAGFLLSVLATLGTTVLVYQKGALGLVEGAPLVSFMPTVLIGIVFGLAMDYQVFLVSRMREMYTHGDSAAEAVEDGFRHGARVVTAAAAIMISVFAAFILQPDSMIASMGFALAVAIVFDAFVVRMTLIPAVMYLLGDRAWWLPAWLDRLIPHIDIEGEKLIPAADWVDEVSHLHGELSGR